MKHFLYVILIAFLSFNNFLFCDADKNISSDKILETDEPQYGGQIVIGVSGDVDSFNPLYTRSALGLEVVHLTLIGLADLNRFGEFEPELTESWQSSADYLKLTYFLRKDAVWSDGVPITAYDVQFTFDLLRDPEVGSPRIGYTEFIKQVIVEDSFTVTFEFSEAYPAQMFDTAGEILPRHILKDVPHSEIPTHEFGRKPTASGPFIINKWESNQYVELVANEKFYAGRPYLDKVIFKIIPDVTNRITQLKTGEVDMLLDVAPEKVQQLEKDPDIEVVDVPGRVYYYVGYNSENPLFTRPVVRRALTMAIDGKKIIDALLYGFGKECVSPFLPMLSWAYNGDIESITFDLQQSKKLLSAEGWNDTDGDGWLDKDGNIFEFTIKTNAGNQLRSDIAVILQDQFKKVGIKMSIELLEWTTLLEDMHNRKFDAYIGGLSSSLYIDPTPIYHSTATDLFNYVSYNNPEVDKLIEQGRVTVNTEAAAQIWKKVQQLIYDDQPYTYLFWIDRVVAFHKRFKNVTPITLSSIYNIEKWYELQNQPQLSMNE
jgi:peptide/nickel transport system substrate-binding protein